MAKKEVIKKELLGQNLSTSEKLSLWISNLSNPQKMKSTKTKCMEELLVSFVPNKTNQEALRKHAKLVGYNGIAETLPTKGGYYLVVLYVAGEKYQLSVKFLPSFRGQAYTISVFTFASEDVKLAVSKFEAIRSQKVVLDKIIRDKVEKREIA